MGWCPEIYTCVGIWLGVGSAHHDHGRVRQSVWQLRLRIHFQQCRYALRKEKKRKEKKRKEKKRKEKKRKEKKRKEKKRKDSVGSDDTASMIKRGGYIRARTRQPPINQKKLLWVRGAVCRSTQTQTLTVVAFVILQCIPWFNECRCMSDGVLIQFVCQVFKSYLLYRSRQV